MTFECPFQRKPFCDPTEWDCWIAPGPKASGGLDACVDVDFAGASWCTWPHSRPSLLCRLHLVPVTCLPRFLPSCSLHSFVLSALFHGSLVPAAVLSCCAQAGLAAISGRVGL